MVEIKCLEMTHGSISWETGYTYSWKSELETSYTYSWKSGLETSWQRDDQPLLEL